MDCCSEDCLECYNIICEKCELENTENCELCIQVKSKPKKNKAHSKKSKKKKKIIKIPEYITAPMKMEAQVTQEQVTKEIENAIGKKTKSRKETNSSARL